MSSTFTPQKGTAVANYAQYVIYRVYRSIDLLLWELPLHQACQDDEQRALQLARGEDERDAGRRVHGVRRLQAQLEAQRQQPEREHAATAMTGNVLMPGACLLIKLIDSSPTIHYC